MFKGSTALSNTSYSSNLFNSCKFKDQRVGFSSMANGKCTALLIYQLQY